MTYTCTVCGHSYTEILPALQPETQPAPTEPAGTLPAPTRPEETRPAPVDKGEKDKGGFPVIPVVLGVLVLFVLLRPKNKGGKAAARNKKAAPAPPYSDELNDPSGDDYAYDTSDDYAYDPADDYSESDDYSD